jgi:prevent-host-death family protein
VKTVNIHEAKTHLSRLVDAAAAGEPFVIAKAGRPMVRVEAVAPDAVAPPRRFGMLAGRYAIPDDFDTLGQDAIAELFENRSE